MNIKDFPVDSLQYEDFENEDIINLYAELPSGTPYALAMQGGFLDRAAAVGVNMEEFRIRWQDTLQSAQAYNMMHLAGLPELENLDIYWDCIPERPEPLIEGILRKGHKMLISGASKAGKSYLLMELAVAIAEGTKWLGFQCKKGRVLYVNLEIDRASCINRFLDIYRALGYRQKPSHIGDIEVWNLRGHALGMDVLADPLIERLNAAQFDAVILDPIYKIMVGDENNASEMGQFCNQFDRVATQTGCSVIYCHHHAKGAMGGRKAQDRASGSGVFARDPDAILDLIELNIPDAMRENLTMPSPNVNCSPWRLEGSLREFANFKAVNLWYDHPLHILDLNGQLEKLYANGDPKENLSKSPNHMKSLNALEKIEEAYDKLKTYPTYSASVKAIADEIEVSERTLRRWLQEKYQDDFILDNGKVYHK